MIRESSQRYIPYMSNGAGVNSQRKASGAVADSLQDARTHPARLMASLFSDPAFVECEVKRPAKLMNQLLAQAAIMQDVEYLGISLYDLFTEEEIYAAWEAENFRRYVMFGPSKRFGDPIIADAKPLLRNIVETAERVVAGEENLSASLRFGHDTYVVPLLALPGCGRYTAYRPWRPTCSSSSSATPRPATCGCGCCTTSAMPNCRSAVAPIIPGRPCATTASRSMNDMPRCRA